MFRLADPDKEMFETFSKGLKAKIEASPEWRAFSGEKAPAKASAKPSSEFDDMSDDVPF